MLHVSSRMKVLKAYLIFDNALVLVMVGLYLQKVLFTFKYSNLYRDKQGNLRLCKFFLYEASIIISTDLVFDHPQE